MALPCRALDYNGHGIGRTRHCRRAARSYEAGVMKTTDVPTPWKTPVAVTRTKSKWHVTRSPTGYGLVVSMFVTSGSLPVGVKVAVDLSDWMTKVAVLPTTCPGVKSPFPLRATSTDCPFEQVNGIVVFL